MRLSSLPRRKAVHPWPTFRGSLRIVSFSGTDYRVESLHPPTTVSTSGRSLFTLVGLGRSLTEREARARRVSRSQCKHCKARASPAPFSGWPPKDATDWLAALGKVCGGHNQIFWIGRRRPGRQWEMQLGHHLECTRRHRSIVWAGSSGRDPADFLSCPRIAGLGLTWLAHMQCNLCGSRSEHVAGCQGTIGTGAWMGQTESSFRSRSSNARIGMEPLRRYCCPCTPTWSQGSASLIAHRKLKPVSTFA